MNGNSGPRLAWVNGQKWQNGNGGQPPTGQKVRPQKAADGKRQRERERRGRVSGETGKNAASWLLHDSAAFRPKFRHGERSILYSGNGNTFLVSPPKRGVALNCALGLTHGSHVAATSATAAAAARAAFVGAFCLARHVY